MGIKRIQNAYFVAGDMAAQRRFYVEGLGLSLKFEDGVRWIQFAVGKANFSLSSRDEAAAGAHGATIVFESDDIECVRERIVRAGGKVLEQRDMGAHGRTITFADPEGNIAQLYEAFAEQEWGAPNR